MGVFFVFISITDIYDGIRSIPKESLTPQLRDIVTQAEDNYARVLAHFGENQSDILWMNDDGKNNIDSQRDSQLKSENVESEVGTRIDDANELFDKMEMAGLRRMPTIDKFVEMRYDNSILYRNLLNIHVLQTQSREKILGKSGEKI